MKEKIYTIPLSEAYETDGECPFCTLEERLEHEAAEYALGASMMEPDSRIISNEKGFCRRHFAQLFGQGNALSLALVLDTHLESVVERMETAARKEGGGRFKKGCDAREALLDVLDGVESSCVICEKLDATLEKFARTFWELYHKESDFHKKVNAGKGFCLPHFALLLRAAPKELSGGKCAELVRELAEIEIANLKRVREDVNWFTKKFDYRFADEPWKNSKDAPPRAIAKLSRFMDEKRAEGEK